MTQISDATKKKIQLFLEQQHKLHIDGRWVDAKSGERLAVENPSTGKTIGNVASAGQVDVDLAVTAARQAFEGPWSEYTPLDRQNLLLKIADLLDTCREQIGYIDTLENGRPLSMAIAKPGAGPGAIFRYYAGWCDKIHGTTHQAVSPHNKHIYTVREPVGVAGLIVPWNFPLGVTVMKLAPALAAGCTCVLKPAEETPLTALYLADLLMQAGLPNGVLNVITGHGHIAGAALAAHHNVDKLAFTGSTEIGKTIVRTSSPNLGKVSLELGGKNPNVIFPDANLDKACTVSAQAAFANAGQNCVALSHVLAHEDIYDEVVSRLSEAANQLPVGDPLDKETVMGPLISHSHMERVLRYIDIGSEEGARLVAGGSRLDREGNFVQPTVFADCTAQMTIVREEIFGPVVAIQKFNDTEAIIRQINASNYGLSAVAWTSSLATAQHLAKRIRSGCIGINIAAATDRDLPFGGFRQSGWGRENGYEGLAQYLETKSVVMAW